MADLDISRSIYRSEKYRTLVQKYAHPQKKGSGHTPSIFSTIKDLMYFAALLGFENNKRIPLSNDHQKEDIGKTEWNNDKNLVLIFAIAFAETNDIDILKIEREEEMIKIFEEYANGGFAIIESWQSVTDDEGITSLITGLTQQGYFRTIGDTGMQVEDLDFSNVRI